MGEQDIPISPESEFFENLAEGLSDDDLDRIGNELSEGFENDKLSLTEMDFIREQYQKLFDLKHEKKTFPWEDAANIKLPVITTSCVNFQARASINLLPPRDIVKGFAVDNTKDSLAKAARVSRHMNWQLMFDMPNFRSSWDQTLMLVARDGSAFRKVYWDSIQEKVISDYILPQDFVINYHTKDLETSQRYTQVLHLTENEIKIKADQGLYLNTEEITIPEIDSTDNVTREARENMGSSAPTPDYATPRDVLEVHTFLNLNKDDDIRQPYIVTMDRVSKKVFRIINRKNPVTQREMCYYVNYTFLPNPESIYGYGFGALLLGANKIMNALINQMTDAGTLSTTRGGWISEGSQISRGSFRFKMGEFKSVRARAKDLRESIFPLEFAPPSSVLMTLVNFLNDYTSSLTTVTELFTGAVPRSDTTATAASLAVEQGAKVFTGIQQRLHASFQKELTKIYDLNGIFLNETEYIDIVSPTDGADPSEALIITRDDYLEPIDVRPVSDPNIISDSQKVAKTEALAQAISQNPFLAQDPVANKILMDARLTAFNESPQIIQQLNAAMDEAIKTAQAQQVLEQEQARQIQEQQLLEQAETGIQALEQRAREGQVAQE